MLLDCHRPQKDGDVPAMQMKACKPDVPIALLSGDEGLPPTTLEAVDAFISKSEPVKELLKKWITCCIAALVSAARGFVG